MFEPKSRKEMSPEILEVAQKVLATSENSAVPELNGKQGQFMAWWPKGMADKPPHGRIIHHFSTSFLAFTLV